MTDQITHRAFFGDAEHTFALTDPMLAELEQITGEGTGALYLKLVQMAHSASILREIIRLGLIGAGSAPEIAHRMVETYAVNRPLSETFPLDFEIMEARWSGAQGDKAAA